jgi:hypothetical protein
VLRHAVVADKKALVLVGLCRFMDGEAPCTDALIGR